jgi:hypothetical protein
VKRVCDGDAWCGSSYEWKMVIRVGGDDSSVECRFDISIARVRNGRAEARNVFSFRDVVRKRTEGRKAIQDGRLR